MKTIYFDMWVDGKDSYIDVELLPYEQLRYEPDQSLIFRYTYKLGTPFICDRLFNAIRMYATLVVVVPMALRAFETLADYKFNTVQEVCTFLERLIINGYEQFVNRSKGKKKLRSKQTSA